MADEKTTIQEAESSKSEHQRGNFSREQLESARSRVSLTSDGSKSPTERPLFHTSDGEVTILPVIVETKDGQLTARNIEKKEDGSRVNAFAAVQRVDGYDEPLYKVIGLSNDQKGARSAAIEYGKNEFPHDRSLQNELQKIQYGLKNSEKAPSSPEMEKAKSEFDQAKELHHGDLYLQAKKEQSRETSELDRSIAKATLQYAREAGINPDKERMAYLDFAKENHAWIRQEQKELAAEISRDPSKVTVIQEVGKQVDKERPVYEQIGQAYRVDNDKMKQEVISSKIVPLGKNSKNDNIENYMAQLVVVGIDPQANTAHKEVQMHSLSYHAKENRLQPLVLDGVLAKEPMELSDAIKEINASVSKTPARDLKFEQIAIGAEKTRLNETEFLTVHSQAEIRPSKDTVKPIHVAQQTDMGGQDMGLQERYYNVQSPINSDRLLVKRVFDTTDNRPLTDFQTIGGFNGNDFGVSKFEDRQVAVKFAESLLEKGQMKISTNENTDVLRDAHKNVVSKSRDGSKEPLDKNKIESKYNIKQAEERIEAARQHRGEQLGHEETQTKGRNDDGGDRQR